MKSIADRVRRLNAAVNAHDLNPIGDMYADDAELTWPGMPTFKGRQAVVAFYAQMFGAFPDVQVTLKRIVEQGDAVAVEYESAGTNGGPLHLPTGELLPGDFVEEVAEEPLRVGQPDRVVGLQGEFPGVPMERPVVGEAVVAPAHLPGVGVGVGVVRLAAHRLVADVGEDDPAPGGASSPDCGVTADSRTTGALIEPRVRPIQRCGSAMGQERNRACHKCPERRRRIFTACA